MRHLRRSDVPSKSALLINSADISLRTEIAPVRIHLKLDTSYSQWSENYEQVIQLGTHTTELVDLDDRRGFETKGLDNKEQIGLSKTLLSFVNLQA